MSTARRIKREEAFTLSMVDLFGCGFIGAIFLFIFNMLQPVLDELDGQSAVASEAAQEGAGIEGGLSGPVFITVKSTAALDFPTWPAAMEPPSDPLLGDANAAFAFIYDGFVP